MTEKLKIFAATVEDTARAQIDEMNECEAYRDCTVCQGTVPWQVLASLMAFIR